MDVKTALTGLSDTEAASKGDQYGPNMLPGTQPKSLFSIILGVVG